MREQLLDLLQCPLCEARDIALLESVEDKGEVREGTLVCDGCSSRFDIDKGIICLLANPSEEIILEIEGWSAKLNLDEYGPASHDHARAWTLALPWLPGDLESSEQDRKAWKTNGSSFEKFVLSEDLAGLKILDIGAGRCWTSAAMVRKGAEVVALDTLTKLYIGLETADVFFEEQGIYFERAQADMHTLPFRDSTFDIVFATATAHHAQDFGRFSSEVRRVLTDDGRFILINEPIAWKGDVPPVEASEGITENMISAGMWFHLFEEGGFTPLRAQAVEGRILSCVLRKRRPDSRIAESMRAHRHRFAIVGRSCYRYMLTRLKNFAARLRSFLGSRIAR
jgi:SAM-dependent methyltransferase/uncharacterized protein YbaR (Trm112 family)